MWQARLASPAWTAEPNAGHLALVDLERQGRLHTLVTQNIDGLHQLAGNDPGLVVELHGTMREVMCLDCGDRGPMEPVLDRLRAGEARPGVPPLRRHPQVGHHLVRPEPGRGRPGPGPAGGGRCDLLLAVGSSLTVAPASGLVPLAKAMGATVVVVNAQPTPYDGMADAVLSEPISVVLPALVGGA